MIPGHAVTELRVLLMLEQRTMADMLGIAVSTLKRWEAGDVIIPYQGQKHLELMAIHYGGDSIRVVKEWLDRPGKQRQEHIHHFMRL